MSQRLLECPENVWIQVVPHICEETSNVCLFSVYLRHSRNGIRCVFSAAMCLTLKWHVTLNLRSHSSMGFLITKNLKKYIFDSSFCRFIIKLDVTIFSKRARRTTNWRHYRDKHCNWKHRREAHWLFKLPRVCVSLYIRPDVYANACASVQTY